MGEKRKNPIIENDDNVDGNLAKKRKKSFQQDIRLFTMRNPIDEADRVNEIMTNNLTKMIGGGKEADAFWERVSL